MRVLPAYAGVVVPGLPFLVYVWLLCRAVVLANSVEREGVLGVDSLAKLLLLLYDFGSTHLGPFGV